MATKIRRSLFIGLGGTGMKTLLQTKKMFIETYGEVPPMIGFLGIDTDKSEYTKTLELTNDDCSVKLEPSEQLRILVDDAKPFYENYKDRFNWIPTENLQALTHMNLGAGQVRTNGRFALTINEKSLEVKITNCINDISRDDISNSSKYELLDSEIEIHMVFSVCGGTGCGTFLNMAYLVKKFAPKCKLTGYGLLPGVFLADIQDGMAKVMPNAYGAIEDLDWMMHLDMNNYFTIQYINSEMNVSGCPFDAFFFIDNKNDNGDTYRKVDQLTQMIGLALITSAGELSGSSKSVGDNIEKNIIEGTMNIDKKRAWVSGMGVSELVFDNERLEQIFINKAAKRIIDRMLNVRADEDTFAEANTWIDKAEVHIRENNGQDNTIDFILKKEPEAQLNIDDIDDAQNVCNNYINSQVLPKDADVDKKINDKTEQVKNELSTLIKTKINQEGGVGAAEHILLSIKQQVDIFISEMTQELKDLEEQHPENKYEANLKNAISDLTHYNSKFIKKGSKVLEKKDDVALEAKEWAICKREKYRRTKAISFFNSIKEAILAESQKVDNIKSILTAICNDCTTSVSQLTNIAVESSTFQIDLAEPYINNVSVTDDEIVFVEFLNSIPYTNKVYDFDVQSSPKADIRKLISDYAETLNSAKTWEKMTIEDAMRKLDKVPGESDEGSALNRILKVALNKAKILLRYKPGRIPKESPADMYFIGVPDKGNSIINDDIINKLTGQKNVGLASIGNKNRVIIYHQFGVIPAFQMEPVELYKEKYDAYTNTNFHIDAILQQRMERENYSLYPANEIDNLLELWVKGFILGLIKNENGKYSYKNTKRGDALDDFWITLDQYRDSAFDAFKHQEDVKDVIKQFNEAYDSYVDSKGQEAIKELMKDVKANYLENYSQIKMTKEGIKRKGNERVKDLITEELNFVKNNL
jgi:hypothetical protein